ncbi:MAG: biopolymer transporter Tol [Chthoniobacterales bacterium]
MKSRFPSRLLGAFLICASTVLAEETPTITVRKSDAIALAVSGIGGGEGGAVTPVLKNDLTLAGAFVLGEAGTASYVVSGSAASGSLDGLVKDRTGGTVLSKKYSGSPRATAHQFANDIVETLTGHPGIATSRIAFVSTRTGRKEIYTADYDGANVKQITNDGVISVAPAISPDASKIAYTGYQSGYADIYLIDLSSGKRDRIVKFPGTNSGAAFSPDGGRIACSISKDGNPELYVVGAGGGGAKRLTRTHGVESSPSWSPDGGEIVFSSDESGTPHLFRISSGGGSARAVSTGYGFCTEPSWSPDGNRIAFTVRQGGFSVAYTDLRSGSSRILASGEDAVWGPDSRHLIYSSGSSLILLDAQNGRSFPIVSGLGKVSEPSWSR